MSYYDESWLGHGQPMVSCDILNSVLCTCQSITTAVSSDRVRISISIVDQSPHHFLILFIVEEESRDEMEKWRNRFFFNRSSFLDSFVIRDSYFLAAI